MNEAVKRSKSENSFWYAANILTLENRLLKACSFHLSRRKEHERKSSKTSGSYKKLNQLSGQMSKVISQLALSDPAFFFNFSINRGPELLRWIEKSSRLKGIKKKAGRPPPPPDIALLLYAALDRAKGKRRLVDQIGRIIEPNGQLHLKIDKKFGQGAFSSLNLPIPNFKEERWERGCKNALKTGAEKFVFRNSIFARRKSKDPGWAEQTWKKAIRDGGISEAEILEESL